MASRSLGICVCIECLRDNSTRIELISHICFQKTSHARAPKVEVVLRGNRLVPARASSPSNGGAALPQAQPPPIRPMPSVFFRGPFVLCDRKRCRGERCTYSHSNEERDAWNAQKFAGRHQVNPPFCLQPQTARPPRPTHPRAPTKSSPPKSWSQVVTGSGPRHSTDQVHSSLPEQLLSFSLRSHEQQQPPTYDGGHDQWPDWGQGLRDVHPWRPEAAAITHPPPPSSYHERGPPSSYHKRGPPSSYHKRGPPSSYHKRGPPSSYHKRGPPSSYHERGPPPSYHESGPPLTSVAKPRAAPRPGSPPELAVSKKPQRSLNRANIQQELTRINYKSKFHSLLDSEETAHSIILEARCNGHYTLQLHQAGLKPPWLKFDAKPFHKRFGYLLGLNGDQIAYATQASEGAFLIAAKDTEIRASIMRENFLHTDVRLYIAFDREGLVRLERHLKVSRSPCEKKAVEVQFELKHSYFISLHKSVWYLPEEVIRRLMPDASDFAQAQATNISLQQVSGLYKKKCSPDQLQALQAIVSCPSSGPPVLIAGPFGTGKTYILATAAHCFFQESARSIRVLVCTHQQVSADSFLRCYFDLMLPKHRDLYITRLTTEYGFRLPELRKYYKTISHFKRDFDRSSHSGQSKYLIITTCMSSRQLADTVPRGFFTHILIDEGAQMREPEAVAPLCLAGERTKIVIAGDQHQVGPAMLVLGEEPQKNGLAVSLLERLHNRYKVLGEMAKGHVATLVTNYRCHSGILKLPEKLFYELPLKCVVPQTSTHPRAPYPLIFVCSSLDCKVQHIESATNESEARIVLDQIIRYGGDWPVHGWGQKDLRQFCVISPTRSQVALMAALLWKSRLPHKLNDVRRLPTYNIQGREFRAVFISTAEPTWEDGDTRNPTKSICDRYVFNTAITRAQSLVVSVGNPFLLLKMEEHMIWKYGSKGRCWSEYLKLCLDNNTFSIHHSLGASEAEKQACTQKLRELVEKRLANYRSDPHVPVQLQPPQSPHTPPAEDQQSLDSQSHPQKEGGITAVGQPADKVAGSQRFKEAMAEGFVESRSAKGIMMGADGSGKTCSMCMILEETPPPPEERQSTPLAQCPVRAVRFYAKNHSKLRQVKTKEMKHSLAKAINAQIWERKLLKQTKERASTTQPSQPQASSQTPPSQSTSSPDPQKEEPTSVGKEATSISSRQSEPPIDDAGTQEELFTLMEELKPLADAEEPLLHSDFVYIIDTGGQPMFHEVLPVFLRNASLCMFVMKLCERLDTIPDIEYFESGSSVCEPVPATQTNEQILKHCVTTIHSHSSSEICPSILVIGTHRDVLEKGSCSETLQDKNQKVREILLPEFESNVISFSDSSAGKRDLIFPINAQNPGDDDQKVAEEIKNAIVLLIERTPPRPIPLRWYALELTLRDIAEMLDKLVLSWEEAFSVARQKLHFSEESFNEAIEYLDDLNIILYYKDILPRVIFCDPHVLIEKISELAKCSFELRNPRNPQAVMPEWRKFKEFGLISKQLLESKQLQKHFQPDLFTPADLIKLFKKLLLLADVSSSASEYFMPCLLPTLPSAQVDENRVSPSAFPAPLIVKLPSSTPRHGVFCSLISFLQSDENHFPCKWNVKNNQSFTPECLFRNCAKFEVSKNPATITLIDSTDFIEVHVDMSVSRITEKFCRQVHLKVCRNTRGALLAGLKKANSTLGYSVTGYSSGLKIAFACQCEGSDVHAAEVEDGALVCDEGTYSEVQHNHQIWFTGETISTTEVTASPIPAPQQQATAEAAVVESTSHTNTDEVDTSSLVEQGESELQVGSSDAQEPRPTVPNSPTNTASAPTSPPQESDREPLGGQMHLQGATSSATDQSLSTSTEEVVPQSGSKTSIVMNEQAEEKPSLEPGDDPDSYESFDEAESCTSESSESSDDEDDDGPPSLYAVYYCRKALEETNHLRLSLCLHDFDIISFEEIRYLLADISDTTFPKAQFIVHKLFEKGEDGVKRFWEAIKKAKLKDILKDAPSHAQSQYDQVEFGKFKTAEPSIYKAFAQMKADEDASIKQQSDHTQPKDAPAEFFQVFIEGFSVKDHIMDAIYTSCPLAEGVAVTPFYDESLQCLVPVLDVWVPPETSEQECETLKSAVVEKLATLTHPLQFRPIENCLQVSRVSISDMLEQRPLSDRDNVDTPSSPTDLSPGEKVAMRENDSLLHEGTIGLFVCTTVKFPAMHHSEHFLITNAHCVLPSKEEKNLDCNKFPITAKIVDVTKKSFEQYPWGVAYEIHKMVMKDSEEKEQQQQGIRCCPLTCSSICSPDVEKILQKGCHSNKPQLIYSTHSRRHEFKGFAAFKLGWFHRGIDIPLYPKENLPESPKDMPVNVDIGAVEVGPIPLLHCEFPHSNGQTWEVIESLSEIWPMPSERKREFQVYIYNKRSHEPNHHTGLKYVCTHAKLLGDIRMVWLDGSSQPPFAEEGSQPPFAEEGSQSPFAVKGDSGSVVYVQKDGTNYIFGIFGCFVREKNLYGASLLNPGLDLIKPALRYRTVKNFQKRLNHLEKRRKFAERREMNFGAHVQPDIQGMITTLKKYEGDYKRCRRSCKVPDCSAVEEAIETLKSIYSSLREDTCTHDGVTLSFRDEHCLDHCARKLHADVRKRMCSAASETLPDEKKTLSLHMVTSEDETMMVTTVEETSTKPDEDIIEKVEQIQLQENTEAHLDEVLPKRKSSSTDLEHSPNCATNEHVMSLSSKGLDSEYHANADVSEQTPGHCQTMETSFHGTQEGGEPQYRVTQTVLPAKHESLLPNPEKLALMGGQVHLQGATSSASDESLSTSTEEVALQGATSSASDESLSTSTEEVAPQSGSKTSITMDEQAEEKPSLEPGGEADTTFHSTQEALRPRKLFLEPSDPELMIAADTGIQKPQPATSPSKSSSQFVAGIASTNTTRSSDGGSKLEDMETEPPLPSTGPGGEPLTADQRPLTTDSGPIGLADTADVSEQTPGHPQTMETSVHGTQEGGEPQYRVTQTVPPAKHASLPNAGKLAPMGGSQLHLINDTLASTNGKKSFPVSQDHSLLLISSHNLQQSVSPASEGNRTSSCNPSSSDGDSEGSDPQTASYPGLCTPLTSRQSGKNAITRSANPKEAPSMLSLPSYSAQPMVGLTEAEGTENFDTSQQQSNTPSEDEATKQGGPGSGKQSTAKPIEE